MVSKSLYIKHQGNLERGPSFSFSRLVIEATIATLVLSVFVASSPRLWTTQPSPSQAHTVVQPAIDQQQI